MQACTTSQTDNHIHPTTKFLTGRIPFLPPNEQRQSTDAKTKLNQKLKAVVVVVIIIMVTVSTVAMILMVLAAYSGPSAMRQNSKFWSARNCIKSGYG